MAQDGVSRRGVAPGRRALGVAAALSVLALSACEPLLAPSPGVSAADRAPAQGSGSPSATSSATPPVQHEEVSRNRDRTLSQAQLSAMTQARMSVSDGDIMRQLANTAERIAQNLAAGGGSAPQPTSVQPGTNRALGYHLLLDFGWPASEWPALDALWQRESGWSQVAENRSSGAYGIPQSLPASKMAAVGADWKTNPETQIRWGLAYIGARYGSPHAAWAHSEKFGWY
ncbi:lytic transglycosylase domain-containing protein [Nocardioides jejuensis]|uniref:Lytic transglycosylase domain-containing protein n=1 Tax=Nocardioides jejuensis TaxID=2502782 RepID=A0A4R1BZ44_9ACTN|nr:lytic transglycosylase domain-containing protein [Nocardioides jejuensis]TCJ23393.1 lytic transglycosylase domain-containing protein [Nocardioides jejuensis]